MIHDGMIHKNITIVRASIQPFQRTTDNYYWFESISRKQKKRFLNDKKSTF